MTSSPHTQDYIGRLSEELRLEVCELLPITALKNFGLANKQWRKSSSSVLWKKFKSGLVAGDRDFDALVLSLPDGLFDNVKSLKIHAFLQNYKNVMQIVSSITRDTLRTVELMYVDTVVWESLLCSQHSIKELTFRQYLINNHPQRFPNPRSLAHSLQKLRKLKVASRSNFDDYSAWLVNTPALKVLSLGSGFGHFSRHATPVPFDIRTPAVGFVPLRLRRLSLFQMILDGFHRLGDILHLPSLRTLDIIHCDCVPVLLRYLTSKYTTSSESALKSFNLTDVDDDDELVESLDQFIGCFSGLETLFVATEEPRRLGVHEVCRHGQTLRFLHLDPLYRHMNHTLSNNRSYYTAGELEILATECPYIEELGIHAAVIDLPVIDLGLPFSTLNGGDVPKALDVLARFRSLRSLRLTHLFTADDDNGVLDSNLNAWLYSRLASKVTQYLVERGSPIEVFAISPTASQYSDSASRDFNGHVWPNYHYVRGTVTIPHRHRHITQAQAIPVTEKNITDYVKYPSLLFRSEHDDFKAYA
ncbi:unnamed protein product [Alternaria burnsii]|nr:unnamed protein product [Alternaria burnsii]